MTSVCKICFANTLIIIGFQFSIFTNEDEPTGTTCGITREPSFVRFMLLWLQGGLVTEPHGPDWQVSISMTADIRNSALIIILFSFLLWIQPVLRQGVWLAQFCKIDGGNGVITHLDTIVKISKRASFPFLEKDRGRLRGSSILRFQKFWSWNVRRRSHGSRGLFSRKASPSDLSDRIFYILSPRHFCYVDGSGIIRTLVGRTAIISHPL